MANGKGAGAARAASAGKKSRLKAIRRERLRKERGWPSRPDRAVRALNRDYVAHERGEGDRALCGRLGVVERVTAKYGAPSSAPHRFARRGEPVMCNACQRERVRLDVAARKGWRPSTSLGAGK
jgi:hypothetical protein